MAIHWFKYASPASFYGLAGRLIPWFTGAAVVTTLVGLYIGLVFAAAAVAALVFWPRNR